MNTRLSLIVFTILGIAVSNAANGQNGNDISFTVDDGTVVSRGQGPQQISGAYAGDIGTVYILLTDSFRRYYVQNPTVEFFENTWLATNVRPGPGIISVRFYQVDAEANSYFKSKIANSEFGGIEESDLPNGMKRLAMISI